ncbi:MAG: glycosyltransferase family 2 protein [Bacteroidales bacterium]|nr:glycosyltransferase family 2 protein [Bacteroidales bacterium]
MAEYSFIIPYFNGHDTIVRCLNSIYSTAIDRDSFEIIIIDDCSPISAESVLADYICNHLNIRIVRHPENRCQGGAKNTGIRLSIGKYIIFADQDDYVISDNLRIAMREALKRSPDMLACKYDVVFENGESVEKGLDRHNSFSIDGKTFCETCFNPGFSLAPWSYLYRRAFLQQVSHPMAEGVLMEDSDWIAWHLIHADKIDYLPLPIYCWVMNPTSITHGQSWRHKADWVKFGYRKIRDSKLYSSISTPFAEIMKADGRYNIEKAFKKLWKTDKYQLFYNHLGNDVLDSIRDMKWSPYITFMLNHPKAAVLCLSLLGPCLKGVHRIYSKFKQ